MERIFVLIVGFLDSKEEDKQKRENVARRRRKVFL